MHFVKKFLFIPARERGPAGIRAIRTFAEFLFIPARERGHIAVKRCRLHVIISIHPRP